MSADVIWLPLAGGALIGLAGALLMGLNGRIAGISGIFGSAITTNPRGAGWRLAFIAGLVMGGVILLALRPESFLDTTERGLAVVAVAGLLVGFGTRLGSGCTSGHGICGVSRLSPRSIVATVTFMVTGIITVALTA